MKRLLPATAVCFALIVPSAAAYPLGHYSGTTSQGLPLSFDVGTQRILVARCHLGHCRTVRTRTIKVVRHFKVKINDFCGSPQNFDTQNYNLRRGYVTIRTGGRFAGRAGPRTQPLTWNGTLTGGRRAGSASGTVSDVTFDEDDAVYCRSGNLNWTAHHP